MYQIAFNAVSLPTHTQTLVRDFPVLIWNAQFRERKQTAQWMGLSTLFQVPFSTIGQTKRFIPIGENAAEPKEEM